MVVGKVGMAAAVVEERQAKLVRLESPILVAVAAVQETPIMVGRMTLGMVALAL